MASKTEHLEKIFFWVLLTGLAVLFFRLLAPFFSPILFSLVVALTAYPLYQGCLKVCWKQRHAAAALCMLLLFIFVATPAGVIGSLVTNQLLKLAQTFQFDPNFLNEFTGRGWVSEILKYFQETLGVEINIGEWLKEMLHNSAQYLYQFSPKVAARTAHFFLTSLISVFLTYFLLVDGPRLYHEILELSPLDEKHERLLAHEIRQTLWACIYGYILTALVQAILGAIGFAIAGLKIFLLLGLATFILSFIPFLGAASVWVPATIYFVATGNYGKAIFMFLYGILVISSIDNFLKPILIQGKTKIHPMLLFLAIFGGLQLWGPIGLLAGPTLVAVFLATLKIYRQDFR